MEPSVFWTDYSKTLIRTTGWASSKSHGKWQAPAILLGEIKTTAGHQEAGTGIMLSGKSEPPVPGEIRAVALKISIPSECDLAGMFDYRLFLAGRGIKLNGKILDEYRVENSGFIHWLYGKILSPVRQKILTELRLILPPLEASLASAVLLGAKDESSREASSPFSNLGLAHLFAVSGLHVGVLLGLFLLPGKLIGISAWQKWFLLILMLPVYALLTGLPGSVVRAAGLALLATACVPMGRIGQPLHYLGILFWITTIWNPDQVLDTGVRLSYSAATGILAFTSLSKDINYPRKGWRGFILGGLFISLSAQWFTLPLAASSFGRISLISPLANLIAIPTFGIGVWLVVLALVGSIMPLSAASFLGPLAWLVFRSLAGLVKIAEINTGGWNVGMPVPGPMNIVVWLVLTILCLKSVKNLNEGKLSGKRVIILISAAGIVLLGLFTTSMSLPYRHHGPEIWQFDVSQGDCSVVRFPDGWTAMIDTAGRFGFSGSDDAGPLSRRIFPWLKRYNLKRLNAVLLTHGHLDHTGGARFLLKESCVDQWFLGGSSLNSLLPDTTDLKMEHPVHGRILHQWKEWSLLVYFPLVDTPQSLHENDFSLVVALRKNDQTQYLWSGDLEKDGEMILLNGPGPGGPTRVWKASHHGSNTSGSQPFLNRIRPDLILISCGVGNSYSHPSHGQYVISGDTIPVVRTDLEGSIHLKFGKNGEIFWESRNRSGQLPATP